MKTTLFYLFALLVCMSCHKSNSIDPNSDPAGNIDPSDKNASAVPLICGKGDPVQELSWLKDKVALQTDKSRPGVLSPFQIVVYNYADKSVIANESFVFSSPYMNVFYCDGSVALKAGEYDKFLKDRKQVKIVYEFKP